MLVVFGLDLIVDFYMWLGEGIGVVVVLMVLCVVVVVLLLMVIFIEVGVFIWFVDGVDWIVFLVVLL